MKTTTIPAAWILGTFIAACPCVKAQPSGFVMPGVEEQAAVDKANSRLGVVYKKLMGALDAEEQAVLREAENSWIKWRDHEAVLMARLNGAVGGSALRVDFANAQLELINRRIAELSTYLERTKAN